jgi:NADH:ubiquinone oxidoreductase subunit 3 (subunit A)
VLESYTYVFLFSIISIIFVTLVTLIPRLVSPKAIGDKKLTTYECGEAPIGEAWIQFNVRYYLIALLFVAFDVEIFFLIPWAMAYSDLPGLIFWFEMFLFVAILAVALAYAWVKGVFEW